MGTARTYVIGDIHGCAEEIDRLLEAIAPAAGDTVVFLGDYVDRGPSPRAVIERLLRLEQQGPRCVFLKGNHEDMLLAYLGLPGMYADAFLNNGGATTLRSYGLEPGEPEAARRMPPEHLSFLSNLQLQYVQGSVLCVHAGLNPSLPVDAQRPEDMLWIRDEFTSHPHAFPYTVIFGHTPWREVLLDLPYKIGLDTGLVYWNKLSCLALEEQCLLQIRRGAAEVERRSVEALLNQSGTRLRRPGAEVPGRSGTC